MRNAERLWKRKGKHTKLIFKDQPQNKMGAIQRTEEEQLARHAGEKKEHGAMRN